jgi:hypothetical protein
MPQSLANGWQAHSTIDKFCCMCVAVDEEGPTSVSSACSSVTIYSVPFAHSCYNDKYTPFLSRLLMLKIVRLRQESRDNDYSISNPLQKIGQNNYLDGMR